jgi:hypothetical protein
MSAASMAARCAWSSAEMCSRSPVLQHSAAASDSRGKQRRRWWQTGNLRGEASAKFQIPFGDRGKYKVVQAGNFGSVDDDRKINKLIIN